MPPRDRDPRFILLEGGAPPRPVAHTPLREILVDELLDALVIFDLLKSDFESEEAAPLLWMRPHIHRIFEEIGTLVEQLGE